MEIIFQEMGLDETNIDTNTQQKNEDLVAQQEEEEMQLQNELNNAFIQHDEPAIIDSDNDSNFDIVEFLSKSQLIARIHQLEKKLSKKEKKISKLKRHVKEYRSLLDNQIGLFEIVCNYVEKEKESL